eukprot:7263802-Pyramimonas_sp.AAC.1
MDLAELLYASKSLKSELRVCGVYVAGARGAGRGGVHVPTVREPLLARPRGLRPLRRGGEAERQLSVPAKRAS